MKGTGCFSLEMIGMRNIMIHEYDNVDMRIVWNTVKKSLPDLIIAIAAILYPAE